MPSIIHYTQCPVCNNTDIKKIFSAFDYTVSKQTFEIWECNICTLRFTQDVPHQTSIGDYYKSEDYISHTNISKGLINRLYQVVRNRTLAQKRNLIKRVTGKKRANLLDVGSGTGAFVNEMKRHGWEVTGIEPDAEARQVADEFFKVTLEDTKIFYDLPSQSFDAITLWHVLEHVHDLHHYVERLKMLLKDQGKLFIAVPNYTSEDAKIYKNFWAAYDVPRHLYHFSPESMEKLMKQHDLNIIDYKPMWFDSFYISLMSSKYKNGHTNWLGALWNGVLSNSNAIKNNKKCSSVIYIISK